MSEIDAIPTHITAVARVERTCAAFVRVTFSGGLDRYVPKGPDDFVYVLLPPRGRTELTIDESFRWSEYYAMEETERPVGAYYTVRHWRPSRGELDCDVYLHEPAGSVSGWVTSARPGDQVALWGPRTAWTPPQHLRQWLLVADETGIPAVRAILDQRPDDVEVLCFLEVNRFDLHESVSDVASGVRIEWLTRGCRPAGTTTLLLDAVRGVGELSPATYVWGGAESRAMAAVRRHVRRELGLPKEQVSLTPYWRHAAHADDEPEPDD